MDFAGLKAGFFEALDRESGSTSGLGGLSGSRGEACHGVLWHSPADLEHVAQPLNGRQRKTLGWRTPAERLRDPLTTTLAIRCCEDPENPPIRPGPFPFPSRVRAGATAPARPGSGQSTLARVPRYSSMTFGSCSSSAPVPV
ncbi:hypothetical protein E1289_25065 [Actinomadura sp. 6K520]|nr:hypothetical protein E1289_25065 [Actinomadura sp. 6K520]